MKLDIGFIWLNPKIITQVHDGSQRKAMMLNKDNPYSEMQEKDNQENKELPWIVQTKARN